jgi:hypothetical protein
VALDAGLDRKDAPQLWLARAERAPPPMHLAFAAADRAQVDAFHRATTVRRACARSTTTATTPPS